MKKKPIFKELNKEGFDYILKSVGLCSRFCIWWHLHFRCISHDLFAGIGASCPNLKVLDLSNAIAISADSLIQLIFRHAYTILHQVAYRDKIEKPSLLCSHS